MKVSVCMLTYNHEKFVAQAIDSFLLQKVNFDIELLISDDCSTDKTFEIVQEYQSLFPDRIKLNRNKKNIGPDRNFTETFFRCEGEYIALLDGDDYWVDKNKLQQQVDFMDTHNDYSFSFHIAKCIHDDNSVEAYLLPSIKKNEFTLLDLLDKNFIGTNTVLLRNKVLGNFPEWFSHLKMTDWPLLIMYAQRGKYHFLPKIMGCYRIHVSSNHSSVELKSRMVYGVNAMKVFLKKLNLSPIQKLIVYRRLIKSYINIWLISLRNL